MKRKQLFGLLLMAMTLGMSFTSCEKDNEDETIDAGECIIEKGCQLIVLSFNIYFDGVYLIGDNWVYTPMGDNYDCSISYVGEVNKLSSINTIPGDWSKQAEAKKGYGYVGRIIKSGWQIATSTYYARFMVTDFIKDANDDVLAVKIRYAPLRLEDL